MRSIKRGLVGAGVGLLLFSFSNVAVARISFGLSIGTSFVHRYPGSYYDCYPYHSWHGGYYTWLDRDRYGWWDAGRYGHFPRRHYWPRRSFASGLGVWIGGYYPMVVDTPVVGVRPIVMDKSEAAERAANAAAAAQLREAMRKRKSKQLKVLKMGDKEKRIQAIRDLAGFSFDDEVRRALEDVLSSDPDPELRKEVAVSFGKTENRIVLAALTQAKAKDPVRDVRQAAYRAIIMIKGY